MAHISFSLLYLNSITLFILIVFNPQHFISSQSLEAEDISVEWTTGEGHIVHAFVKGKDDLSDSQFKGRSQLFTSELSCGNFSLILSNVSVTDKGEFNCHYHHSSIGDNSSKLLSKHCLLVVVAGEQTEHLNTSCVLQCYVLTGGAVVVLLLYSKETVDDCGFASRFLPVWIAL
uniref:Ig-like domain-containing protein n=1 Tax=Erpetoichthys calabaricus TaxID=27687 RepID=A0A8C4T0I6_ERPCA